VNKSFLLLTYVNKLLTLVLIGWTQLSGCSPTLGETFHAQAPPLPQKAVAYLYRLKEGVDPSYPIGITVDGVPLASLPFNSYVRHEVVPGEVEFTTKFLLGYTESVTLDIESKGTYFLKVEMRVGGFLITHAIIARVFPEEALQEIQHCRQVVHE